ncbi:MAG: hypothetical protein ACJAVY_002545 [Marinoscillum sp.]|jgi:hypothetical protein
MKDIPLHVSATFIACVITCFGFMYYAVTSAANKKEKSKAPMIALFGMIGWIGLHTILTNSGYFQDFEAFPPRIFLFVGATLLFIIILFAIPRGRAFLAKMPITTLTYIHLIRVPVEIVLFWLFLNEVVPADMTFEGSNLDILSGITAPFVGVFLVGKKRSNRIGAILWNLVALGLLFNIVITAILATPYFNEVQSGGILNSAIFYSPFSLLPLFVVPVVLFSHLVSLYQLIFVQEDY